MNVRNITTNILIDLKVSPERSILLKPGDSRSISKEEYDFCFSQLEKNKLYMSSENGINNSKPAI